MNRFIAARDNAYSKLCFDPSSSFGMDLHFQMLVVMVLSQHRLSTTKTVSPRIAYYRSKVPDVWGISE